MVYNITGRPIGITPVTNIKERASGEGANKSCEKEQALQGAIGAPARANRHFVWTHTERGTTQ